MKCVYCEKPLECEACREPYEPPGRLEYEALHRVDVPVTCPSCGSTLVCHWCQTPYDGEGDDSGD